MDILKLWQGWSRYPGGAWLLSKMVGRFAPYSGSISPRIVSLQPGRSVVAIRDRHKLRNHLGSVHAIALINLGEFSSGLALFTLMPASHRGIITAISMRYLKKARGRIEARCQIEVPTWPEQDVENVFHSELFNADGDIVAIADVTWRLGKIDRSANQN